MTDEYELLLQSDRVGPTTREVLVQRDQAISDAVPRLLDRNLTATLEAVVRRLIPQAAGGRLIDIAARIDRVLTENVGDGWRFADLPPDRDAFAGGLQAIDAFAGERHGCKFGILESVAQDDLLRDFAAGGFESKRMNVRRWFDDLVAMASEIYMSHPTTLARIGFSGIAFRPKWPAVNLGSTQPWEPAGQ